MQTLCVYQAKMAVTSVAPKATIVVFCLFGSLMNGAVSHAQQATSARRALDAYRQYLSSIEHVTFSSTFKSRDADKDDAYTLQQEDDWKIDFPGKRLWRTMQTVKHPSASPADLQNAPASESLLTPDAAYHVMVDTKTNTAIQCGGTVPCPPDDWARKMELGVLAYPFGYIHLGRPEYDFIPELLEGATTATDQSGKVTLKKETGEYRLSVRLDPSHSWMADRIEYTALGPADGTPRIDSCRYVVLESHRHDDAWLPTRYEHRVTTPAYEYVSKDVRVLENGSFVAVNPDTDEDDLPGKPHIVRSPGHSGVGEVSLSKIILRPLTDDDFHLQAKAPEGLGLSLEDVVRTGQVLVNGQLFPNVTRR